MKTVQTILMVAVVIAAFGVARLSPAQESKSGQPAKQVVAVFRLAGQLNETSTDVLFATGQSTALSELSRRMRAAAADKDVKAVVLTLSDFQAGSAQIEELRQSMAQLRGAGKDIFAHSDSLDMSSYVLLCGATQI